jgi:hypothetical protein
LALLVARIAAHDVHDATAADDFTLVANTLDAGFDFHDDIRRTEARRRHPDGTGRTMAVNA